MGRDTDVRLARLVAGVLHASSDSSKDMVDAHAVAVTVEARGGGVLENHAHQTSQRIPTQEFVGGCSATPTQGDDLRARQSRSPFGFAGGRSLGAWTTSTMS